LSGGLVTVEASADRWKPDPPTRDAYTVVVKEYFGTLFAAYNQCYGDSLELHQGDAHIGRHALPPATDRLFRRFVTLTRHDFDPNWNAFYDFVRACHAWRVKLDDSELCHFLEKEEFSKEAAREICAIYAHCRAVLRR
jgi:hypothetical protein